METLLVSDRDVDGEVEPLAVDETVAETVLLEAVSERVLPDLVLVAAVGEADWPDADAV